jgi:predicted lipid-binding transport protein (Tim44 family)
MMPYGNGYWGGRGMMGFSRMMPFGGLFGLFGLFGGLIALGVLVLIVLAIIWFVRALRKPVTLASAPVAVVNPVVPAVATHSCQKCDEPIQENWKFCPHCGKRQ